MIKTHDLTKKYGDLFAIRSIELDLKEGDLFGFIGPNGAGKTTTMRIIATLLNPTWGEAYVCDNSIYTRPKEIRRLVGYMPDFFGVYDDMKVIEYLEFFAACYRIKGPKRRKVCNEMLDLVDLGYKRHALVTSLSRGMTQRLCLAKTLVHEPPVLILDEPASGLDPRARVEVKALLKELRNMGKTTLISSHILSELADCCTSIGIIEQGKLVETPDGQLMCGPIAEVYRRIRLNRIVEIKFIENAELGLSIVRRLAETRNVEIDNNRVTVELAANERQVATLMERLIAAGVRMHSFADKEPTLEDVFMLVTKGAVA